MKTLCLAGALFWVLACGLPAEISGAVALTDRQAYEIGRRIWKNECAGTLAGLTSWNRDEEFPSLGIAHFIWYPSGSRGPFEESFPGLVAYLESSGHRIPSWLKGSCPWPNRSAFLADLDGKRLKTLRALLAKTIAEQARYAALRLERALPKMLDAAPPHQREKVRENFFRVAKEPLGLYALMDYVNFKGEGVSPTERYAGQGWGLLQVLEGMPATGPALQDFSRSAENVLERRVKNAPSGRHEAKWLPGWKNRIATYQQ